MKHSLFIIFISGILCIQAQTATDVYIAQLFINAKGYKIKELKNLSQNVGYDNQPSFWSNEQVLFAATRNGQTDVIQQSLNKNEKKWICQTAQGSEYSPQRIPTTKEFSAIRLDSSGLQRLYRYTLKGDNSLVSDDLKIGYHLWIDAQNLLCTVLVDNHMDLYWLNLDNGQFTHLDTHVGRSLHHVPKSRDVSYIRWENERSMVILLNRDTNEKKHVFTLPKGIQDHAWLPNGNLIFGQNNILLSATPNGTSEVFHQFNPQEIRGISRIAISPNGQYIAMVGEEK